MRVVDVPPYVPEYQLYDSYEAHKAQGRAFLTLLKRRVTVAQTARLPLPVTHPGV